MFLSLSIHFLWNFTSKINFTLILKTTGKRKAYQHLLSCFYSANSVCMNLNKSVHISCTSLRLLWINAQNSHDYLSFNTLNVQLSSTLKLLAVNIYIYTHLKTFTSGKWLLLRNRVWMMGRSSESGQLRLICHEFWSKAEEWTHLNPKLCSVASHKLTADSSYSLSWWCYRKHALRLVTMQIKNLKSAMWRRKWMQMVTNSHISVWVRTAELSLERSTDTFRQVLFFSRRSSSTFTRIFQQQ